MLTMRRTVADGVRMCTGLAAPEQHRADRDAAAGRGLEQVVGDVGGVDVRQHQQVGLAGQRAVAASAALRVARRRAPRRRASRRRPPARAPARAAAPAPRASSRADGWLLEPKLECDSSAALGCRPKRSISSAAMHGDLGQLLGGRVVVDVGVDQHDLAVRQHQRRSCRRRCLTPARLPITWSMYCRCIAVRAPGAADHAVDLALVQQHRADQRQAAAHLDLGQLRRHALALGHAGGRSASSRGSARRARG